MLKPYYSQSCSMKPVEVFKLSKMVVLHPEFSAIRIIVNQKRNTYRPFQAETIPQGNMLVTLQIPRRFNMVNFFGEFSKALNQESSIMSHGERKR